MRKWIIMPLIVLVLILSIILPVQASSPFDVPPGLEKAIAAQEAHTNRLLNIPGVVGTAVGFESGKATVQILVERPEVAGLPRSLDGIPVVVLVTGKLVAQAKPAPTASFDYTTDLLTVYVDASSSSGTQLNYSWDFEGNIKTGVTTSYTFGTDGDYPVTLTVTDKFGQTGSTTQTVSVSSVPLPNQSPVASFTYSPHGLTVDFDASGSTDSDGNITEYSWNFGDNNTGSGVTISHTYAAAGTYSVSLTVTDNLGATDTIDQNILVSEATVVDPTDFFTRPVPIGVSSGSERIYYDKRGQGWISAGTLGARVKRGDSVFILSNNHVYAQENQGETGDRILQPGRLDMPNHGTETEIADATIGTLEPYIDIIFSRRANNIVDAAIASTTTSYVGNATPSDGYGTPSSTIATADLNLPVQKYGRTTGLTTGKVTGINATVLVSYSTGTARFVNQVIITGDGGSFSQSGDSGSLIVTRSGNQPVALLFAGSETITIGNPIGAVLDAYSVTIDGN